MDEFWLEQYRIKFPTKKFKYITEAERIYFHKILITDDRFISDLDRFPFLSLMRGDLYLEVFHGVPSIETINKCYCDERTVMVKARKENIPHAPIKETDFVWFFDTDFQIACYKARDINYTSEEIENDIYSEAELDVLLDIVDNFYYENKDYLKLAIKYYEDDAKKQSKQ